jgi:hypothetical protein
MRRPADFRLAFACLVLIAVAGSASAQGYTTRIETRPFYGAIVTLEEGVRVIRPLPPERHVIINPNNTPLSFNFNDTRVYENRVIKHQYDGASGAGYPRGGAAYGYLGGGGPAFGHRKGYGMIKRLPGYATESRQGGSGFGTVRSKRY